MLRSKSKQSGDPCSESWRRKKEGCGGKDLQKRKVLSLDGMKEWLGDGIPSNSWTKYDCWQIMTVYDPTVKCSAQ